MKTKFRKIAALALSLVLICALAVVAFASTTTVTDYENYIYDNVLLQHKLVCYENRANAVITLLDLDGTAPNQPVSFSYSGTINYQYCWAEQVRPNNYVSGTKSDSGSSSTYIKVITTGSVGSDNIMIDASMTFNTTFVTDHATVIHNNPDTIYVSYY